MALPSLSRGSVWIVGAGPGDPGLLTLLAAQALSQADIVFHDALVSDEILARVPRRAKRVFVGKRAGRPSLPQDRINALLVAAARAGRRVVRLKGGDPLLFGRGAEEAEALMDAGIAFRIVPGITSGIGGLAYAGIPATHRETNHAVTFVTGHLADADDARTDWAALAHSGTALVVYMPLARLGAIAARLMAGGLAGDTPAAFVERATTREQRVIETTLAAACADAQVNRVEAPALFVVGANAARRTDWLAYPAPDNTTAASAPIH
jgi:uroporphyrin-III C-methyltransferase